MSVCLLMLLLQKNKNRLFMVGIGTYTGIVFFKRNQVSIFEPPRLHFERPLPFTDPFWASKAPEFWLADADPDFHSNADPNTASKNTCLHGLCACGSGSVSQWYRSTLLVEDSAIFVPYITSTIAFGLDSGVVPVLFWLTTVPYGTCNFLNNKFQTNYFCEAQIVRLHPHLSLLNATMSSLFQGWH